MSVSVIIPSFNHATFLRERLESISSQTLKYFECIVLDDCSIDNSQDIIQEFLKTDNRFSSLYNQSNSGSTFLQWNKGVSQAKGEYIWIAESDDMADPYLLQTLVERLDSDPGIVLAYSQSNRMSIQGELTGSWLDYTSDLDPDGLFETDFVMDGKEYINRFLIHRNTIPNASAVVFRKSIYSKIGGAPEELKNNGDWLTWLKMLCYGDIAYVAQPLNYFRYHDTSVIARISQQTIKGVYKEQYDYRIRKVFSDFIKKNNISFASILQRNNAKYISWDIGNMGLFYLKEGHLIKGWKLILQASVYPIFQTGFIKRAIGIK